MPAGRLYLEVAKPPRAGHVIGVCVTKEEAGGEVVWKIREPRLCCCRIKWDTAVFIRLITFPKGHRLVGLINDKVTGDFRFMRLIGPLLSFSRAYLHVSVILLRCEQDWINQ